MKVYIGWQFKGAFVGNDDIGYNAVVIRKDEQGVFSVNDLSIDDEMDMDLFTSITGKQNASTSGLENRNHPVQRVYFGVNTSCSKLVAGTGDMLTREEIDLEYVDKQVLYPQLMEAWNVYVGGMITPENRGVEAAIVTLGEENLGAHLVKVGSDRYLYLAGDGSTKFPVMRAYVGINAECGRDILKQVDFLNNDVSGLKSIDQMVATNHFEGYWE